MAEHWTPTPGGFQPGATEPEDVEQQAAEECRSGTTCSWSCDLHVTCPPMTAEAFDAAAHAYAGVSIAEGEDGDHVWAYGHICRGDMAKAVAAYDRDMAGGDVYETPPSDIRNVWAVLTQDGDWITWQDVTETTPNAFPLTVVTR